MVQFMSQSDFNAGGPYAGGAGSTATGFARLGEVLAQAPMMRARAGYYGSEAQRAQTQTQQLQQQIDVARGRQDRINEAMGILSNPGSLHDPAVAARLSAIALADPDIAAHFPGLLAGISAVGALSGKYSAAERDALSAASGVAAYGNTQTGQGAQLANTTGNIVVTGQQQRQTDDNQITTALPPGAPPGTQPTSMSRGEVKARGWTEVPASAVATNVGPAQVLDATGKPVTTSGGQAQQTGATPILGTDPAKGAIITNTVFPPGGNPPPANAPPAASSATPAPPPQSSTSSTPPLPVPPVPPQQPPQQQGQNTTGTPSTNTAQADDGSSLNLAKAELADSDSDSSQPPPGSDLAAIMSGVKTAQATPSPSVPGTVMAAGPAAGTPPQAPPPAAATSVSASASTPPQPAQPPLTTTAQPSPVTPPQGQGQGGLGQQFQDDTLARATRTGQILRALEGQPPLVPPVVDVPPDTEKKIKAAVAASAQTRYPLDPGATMGSQGYPAQWSPEAFDAIHQRVGQLFASTDPRFRGNVDTSIQQAISELQTGGRIPPAGYAKQGSYGGDWFGGWGVGGGSHNIALAPPGSKFDAQGNQVFPQQGQGTTAAPASAPAPAAPAQAPANQNQGPPVTATNAKTGQRYLLVNGQWVETTQQQAQGQ